MAVSRAPKRPSSMQPQATEQSEEAVLEVIQRGGSVKRDKTETTTLTDPLKNVQLRLYQSTLAEIDQLRKRDARGRRAVSRHAWMLQAIEQKLGRER